MSFRDRVVDGVSGLLFERLNEGESIGGVDPIELEKELIRRRAQHKALGNPSPSEHKKAKVAWTGAKAKKERVALAAARTKRIHAKRAKLAAEKRKQQDANFKEMAEEARRNPPRERPPRERPPRTSGSSGRSSSSRSSSSRRSSIFQSNDLAAHYKTLGVEYGADAKIVKKAYRLLMRKYHPDLHMDPKKKKAATKLTVKISAAYAAIEKK